MRSRWSPGCSTRRSRAAGRRSFPAGDRARNWPAARRWTRSAYSAASLAGPALAAVIAAGLGARVAVLAAAALVGPGRSLGLLAVAVPAGSAHVPAPRRPAAARSVTAGLRRDRDPAVRCCGPRRPRRFPTSGSGCSRLLPGARRAAARRSGPRRAADQRDGGRRPDRQRDPGPPAGRGRAGRPGLRQHAGDRREHGRGGDSAGLAHPGRRRAGRGRRGAAADGAVRGAAPGNPRSHARAGLTPRPRA